ncbi:hypothetical protein [Orrella marina]|uniref:Uncharacterized protein n=1 Tax=Orrella marina TaxID=2163011 RepID=A0A2R4XF64_9BURK|nr:hypothetical protein [Orrella marina]AWB32456.1 hypothetical protein DBV39_00600 [Orrella marina]
MQVALNNFCRENRACAHSAGANGLTPDSTLAQGMLPPVMAFDPYRDFSVHYTIVRFTLFDYATA